MLPSISVSFQKEWDFLCACASSASTAAEISELLDSPLDWDVVLDVAEQHGVSGLLAKRLGEVTFAGVPVENREQLQTRIRAQHLFTLSMTADLFRILQDFSVAHIDTMLIKGPLISLLAYGDSSLRRYVDVDLLVRHRDIAAATRRMLEMGFQADIPESAIRAGKIPGEYLFRKPGTQRIVELHTENTFRYYPKHMPLEDLFTRSRTVLLDGREVPALSLEDELILTCVHGAKHFWERLIWIADVAALIARHPEIDWAKVHVAVTEVGAQRILRAGIQLASLVLKVPLPAAIAAEIRQDRASALLCRRIQGWLPYAGAAPPSLPRRAMFRLKMAGGGLSGFAYLTRLSLSPTQEDWAKGAEERRSWFWDAVRRPFRLLRKYGQD